MTKDKIILVSLTMTVFVDMAVFLVRCWVMLLKGPGARGQAEHIHESVIMGV